MSKTPNLPPHLLAAPFTVAHARSAGIDPAQLRTRTLQRSFYAVRSRGLDLSQLADRCLAYSARMGPTAVFSHATSARLHGFPLALAAADDGIHITVPVPTRAASGAGIRGHQQRLLPDERRSLNGLAVASPAATWAQLGEMLSVDDMIAVGEYIITGNPYEKRLPLATIDDLSAAAAVRNRGPGHRTRMAALPQMREGAYSRPETFVRLLLTRCGLPDPAVNADVLGSRGEFIAMPDLQWPELRVALEYQGDHHRGKEQFRRDVSRLEKLIDADWLVMQVTAAELFGDPQVIVERVARRLASRGWAGRIHLRHLTTFTP